MTDNDNNDEKAGEPKQEDETKKPVKEGKNIRKSSRKRCCTICDNNQEHAKKPKEKGIKHNVIDFEAVGLWPPPALQTELRDYIKGKEGTVKGMVIMKQVWGTDLSKNQGRFSIPVAQVYLDYLTRQEKTMLDESRRVEVTVVEPWLEENRMQLTTWKMNNSTSYMLISGWSLFLRKNEKERMKKEGNESCSRMGKKASTAPVVVLKENDILQIWAFQVNEELHLATVKVPLTHEHKDSNDNGSTVTRQQKQKQGFLFIV